MTTTVKVAHIRLCHSRMFLVVAYPRETQEMVFGAHDRWFRIRVENESKAALCLKLVRRNDKGEYVYSDEREILVSDPSIALMMLEDLGYSIAIHVKKQREEWRCGKFKVAYDDVDGLGKYFEVETHTDFEEVQDELESIHSFIRGIAKEFSVVTGGYPQLLMIKKRLGQG
ncbi:MAG: CYTH domain-containing protein [Alphaproteobacteria bacterium]|nr:CYTH domain-containing protein [Alphaproteobacteria bacterium]